MRRRLRTTIQACCECRSLVKGRDSQAFIRRFIQEFNVFQIRYLPTDLFFSFLPQFNTLKKKKEICLWGGFSSAFCEGICTDTKSVAVLACHCSDPFLSALR